MTHEGLTFCSDNQAVGSEGRRGGLRLRGVIVRTSREKGTGIKKSVDPDDTLLLPYLENNKNKNFMFIILCYNVFKVLH
jgi:hypothetical protein